MTSLIGAPLHREDALGKVTGATRYPADLVRPGMLHLQAVFAQRAHARIHAIDTGQARSYPGVVSVLTAADVPYNAYGLIHDDQPVLCKDIVRFEGDRVALVIAESKAAARAAAALVAIEYEDLPAVSDPRAALQPGAPLVHEELGSNLLYHAPLRKGDAAAAMQQADVVVEGEFSTSWQEHAYLQPEAGISYIEQIEGRERLVIESAGQWLHEDRRQIAKILQIAEEDVIIRYAAIGGAFGGREDLSIQPLLALATWRLRRPAAMVWSREESIVGHHKRHPVNIRCRWGARRDGTLAAVEAEIIADGGAYASTSEEVVKVVTLFANGCYEAPNISADGYAVYTNNVPCGAFRGFGAPQAHFATEIMIERLAHKLGLNPLEVRRRNIYREGGIESTQQPLPPGVSALEVLERCVVEARERLRAPQAADPGAQPGAERARPAQTASSRQLYRSPLRRGVGIACAIKNLGYSFGFPEQATATVELFGGARIDYAVVRVGAADVGQGVHTILRQIAADALAIPLESIEMVCDDSNEAPNAGSASASRMTLVVGRAVHDAAYTALQSWQAEDRPARGTVQYRPPATTPFDSQTGACRPNYAYGYAAQAVEVEVNTLTGQVRVTDIISVHDVGKAINRQQVEGQILGGIAQGLGYALTEHFQVREGRILTPNFTTYLLPTVLDMPESVVPIILELPDPNGPHGARGMAELPLVALAPAIAIAIHDATGAWVTQQPMTPERVLAALQHRVESSAMAETKT